MARTRVTQPARYQGQLESTKYVNKVTFDASGNISVTATPVVPKNLLTEPTVTPLVPQTNNQIVGGVQSTTLTAKPSPTATITDPQGIIIPPQPPGPRI